MLTMKEIQELRGRVEQLEMHAMTRNHHFQYYDMTYPPNQSVSAFINNCQVPNTNHFISNFQPSVPDIQSFTNNPQPPVPNPFIDNLQLPVPGSQSSNNQLTPHPIPLQPTIKHSYLITVNNTLTYQ